MVVGGFKSYNVTTFITSCVVLCGLLTCAAQALRLRLKLKPSPWGGAVRASAAGQLPKCSQRSKQEHSSNSVCCMAMSLTVVAAVWAAVKASQACLEHCSPAAAAAAAAVALRLTQRCHCCHELNLCVLSFCAGGSMAQAQAQAQSQSFGELPMQQQQHAK
jgi:hypothetical protein